MLRGIIKVDITAVRRLMADRSLMGKGKPRDAAGIGSSIGGLVIVVAAVGSWTLNPRVHGP